MLELPRFKSSDINDTVRNFGKSQLTQLALACVIRLTVERCMLRSEPPREKDGPSNRVFPLSRKWSGQPAMFPIIFFQSFCAFDDIWRATTIKKKTHLNKNNLHVVLKMLTKTIVCFTNKGNPIKPLVLSNVYFSPFAIWKVWVHFHTDARIRSKFYLFQSGKKWYRAP